MSDTPPEPSAPSSQEPPAPEAPPPDPGPATDPWADPASARAEIEKLRKESAGYRTKLREAEPLAKRAKELEEASKSELEKLNDRNVLAEQRAVAAELKSLRLEVAHAKGLTPAQAKRLDPTLTTREDLESDADELLAAIGPAKPPPGDPKPDPSGRPKESMGSVPLPGGDKIRVDESDDPRELAKRIKRHGL